VTTKPAMMHKPFNPVEFFLRWEWILVALIVIATIINASISPYFLNTRNLFDMTFNFMEKGLMALPMTFIIITGGIDLSVASTLAMSSNVMGRLFAAGMNIWVAALVALLVGTLAGLINGLLITRLKLPALAATLGTYVLYRGIAWVLMQDGAVTGFPAEFTVLGQGYIPGTPIPIPLVIFAVLAVPFGLVLHRTTLGRFTYAFGNNKEACRFAGVNIDRLMVILFTVSGLVSALAGIVMTARFGSVRADIALGTELDVITTVVLGGVDIAGGAGTMLGVVLSLFLLGIVRYGMNLVNVAAQIQIIITGFLLIAAIVLPYLLRQLTAQRSGPAVKKGERGWGPWAAGGAVIALALIAFFMLQPGGPSAPGGGQTPGSQAVVAATATEVMILPTDTPVAAPPTPTPRPTRVPTATPTPAPTSATETQATAAPTPTPDLRPEVDMVEVPAGPFIMGDDGGDPKEAPAHEVNLPTFYIDTFETTNANFAAFVKATGYQTDAEKAGAKQTWQTYAVAGKENHPVVKVTFNDAQAFCAWMGRRLPTEAEWEKAARGTDQREFPWGDLWDTTRANVKLSGLRGTTAVGSFASGASPYGAEDMSGNVAEWTSSPFVAYPGSTYQDPQYTPDARVIRGGGWFDEQNQVRTTSRNGGFINTANDDLGFRCASDKAAGAQ
jgi:rhamnose transport system permease protein